LLRQYSFAHTVVSPRLHGGLPAFGIDGTRVLNLSVDVRGTAVQVLPKIQNLQVGNASPDAVLTAIAKLEPSESADLHSWEKKYQDVIRTALPNNFE